MRGGEEDGRMLTFDIYWLFIYTKTDLKFKKSAKRNLNSKINQIAAPKQLFFFSYTRSETLIFLLKLGSRNEKKVNLLS